MKCSQNLIAAFLFSILTFSQMYLPGQTGSEVPFEEQCPSSLEPRTYIVKNQLALLGKRWAAERALGARGKILIGPL